MINHDGRPNSHLNKSKSSINGNALIENSIDSDLNNVKIIKNSNDIDNSKLNFKDNNSDNSDNIRITDKQYINSGNPPNTSNIGTHNTNNGLNSVMNTTNLNGTAENNQFTNDNNGSSYNLSTLDNNTTTSKSNTDVRLNDGNSHKKINLNDDKMNYSKDIERDDGHQDDGIDNDSVVNKGNTRPKGSGKQKLKVDFQKSHIKSRNEHVESNSEDDGEFDNIDNKVMSKRQKSASTVRPESRRNNTPYNTSDTPVSEFSKVDEVEEKTRPKTAFYQRRRKNKEATALQCTLKDLKSIDPLDYLAKYCIIRPEKLPHYERVFTNVDREEKDDIDLYQLDYALKAVNNDLISENEISYVHQILELSQRYRINFRLFTVIAALSEKIVALDDLVKNLINTMDLAALETKLKKCKELFYLLDDMDGHRGGVVTINSLSIELTAGGLTQEHVDYVCNHLNHESRGLVEFIDYLTYVPLFVEIHDSICFNPLDVSRSK